MSRLLLATFLIGAIGVLAELLLIGHFEDSWQIIPLGLLGLATAAAAWVAGTTGATARKSFAALMALMAVSGVVGQWLHYRGNMEFEIERDSSLSGWALFAESMTGATPALAPGTMVLLALVGYAWLVSRKGG